MPAKLECSMCNVRPHRPGQRTCRECHAEEQRKYRTTHPVEPEHKHKGNCRSYAHVYRNRGKLKKQPCIFCRSNKSQMHHPDYSRPLLVLWLCDYCHTELHEWDEKLSLATGLRGLTGEMS